jgi:hypothetical protein
MPVASHLRGHLHTAATVQQRSRCARGISRRHRRSRRPSRILSSMTRGRRTRGRLRSRPCTTNPTMSGCLPPLPANTAFDFITSSQRHCCRKCSPALDRCVQMWTLTKDIIMRNLVEKGDAGRDVAGEASHSCRHRSTGRASRAPLRYAIHPEAIDVRRPTRTIACTSWRRSFAMLGASLISLVLPRQTRATVAPFDRRLLAPCRGLVRCERRKRTRLASTRLIAKATSPRRRLKAIARVASPRSSVTSCQATRMMRSAGRLRRSSAQYSSSAACHPCHRNRRGWSGVSKHASTQQNMART